VADQAIALENRCGRLVFGLAWLFAKGTSEFGAMLCCSVQRTDTRDDLSGPMDRRASERCRDRDGGVGRELTGSGSTKRAVAEFAA
jgi:hypothetical protein